jgi:hypothetical protein
LAIERDGVWHVFKRFGQVWRHQGRAKGAARGRQSTLLEGLAAGEGFLGEEEAIRGVRQTPSRADRQKIKKTLTPEISRLRKVMRRNVGIDDSRADPLPRDRHLRGWRAAIAIGYAVKDDADHLTFRLRSQLSSDEQLDV